MNDISIDIINAVKEIKSAIVRAQARVSANANAEMLSLYFGIGRYVSYKTQTEKWGTGIIDTISAQLQKEMPGLRGFSGKSIRKMRQFYEAWSDSAIWPSATAKLESGGNALSIEAVKSEQHESVGTIWPSATTKLEAANGVAVTVAEFLSISFSYHMEILLGVKTLEERLFYIHGGLNLYAFCMDSPIGIIDPMGNDAYISGSSGHATMWVDEPGENGKVAIFDFGPPTGGWNDYNRNLIYGKGKTVVTRSNKKDSMGRYDVRIVTSEATDRAIIDCMEQYKKEDHDYSFLFNNCAQAVRAVLIRSGVDDIGWCVWPEGLVESIRNRGGSYEPYNVFSHNPYFCPLK